MRGRLSDSGLWNEATSSKLSSISSKDAILAHLPSSCISLPGTKVGRWRTLVCLGDSTALPFHNNCSSLGLFLCNVYHSLDTKSLEALTCD